MIRQCLLFAMIAAIAPVCFCTRLPVHGMGSDGDAGWMQITGDGSIAQDMVMSLRNRVHSSVDRKGRDRTAYVAVKYYLRPSDDKDFQDAWKDFEKGVEKEKGNIMFDLKKVISNNFEWVQYGEWESYDQLQDHLEAEYTRKFYDFIADKSIVVKINLLRKVVDEKQPKKKSSEDNMTHLLIKYYVPPEVQKDFVKEWENTARDTWEEKGNNVYALRKLGTDNVQFYGYGTWESKEAFKEHFTSDHAKKLRNFLNKEDIVYVLDGLYKIGHQPELV